MANKTIYLLNCDTVEVADVVGGELYKLPPLVADEQPVPVEFENPFHANALVEHKGRYHAIVEVEQVKTPTGITFNVEEAVERGKVLQEEIAQERVQQYVREQLEERVAKNLPPLRPNGEIARLIKERGINLQDLGLPNPIGFERGAAQAGRVELVQAGQQGNAELAALVKSLADSVRELKQQTQDQADQLATVVAEKAELEEKLSAIVGDTDKPQPDSKAAPPKKK